MRQRDVYLDSPWIRACACHCGQMRFKRREILDNQYSLKGSISNLQEFSSKNCYNGSGAVQDSLSLLDWPVLTVHFGIGNGFRARYLTGLINCKD